MDQLRTFCRRSWVAREPGALCTGSSKVLLDFYGCSLRHFCRLASAAGAEYEKFLLFRDPYYYPDHEHDGKHDYCLILWFDPAQ